MFQGYFLAVSRLIRGSPKRIFGAYLHQKVIFFTRKSAQIEDERRFHGFVSKFVLFDYRDFFHDGGAFIRGVILNRERNIRGPFLNIIGFYLDGTLGFSGTVALKAHCQRAAGNNVLIGRSNRPRLIRTNIDLF